MATLASGLAPFTHRFFPAVGMTLFIVLSIATSGGAAPAVMLPTFFQYVHAVIPLGNAMEAALRSALCFGGAGMLRPVLVLCAWIAAGIALLGLDARRHQHAARTGGRCRAPVTVLDPGGRQLVSTLTDTQGEYAATGLPEGYLSIVAALPGRQPAVQRRPLRRGAVVRAVFLLRDREDAPGTGLTTAATAGR
ncbi:hypothetical protein [Streptomyces sp. SID6139]|uniref:hypothetical protein n=1 Tax=Streptomyces sp. SID6139 TaxID=2690320 RepID=UPI001369EF1C|nr:hypothetical protein [Streptomyces sp. SID6139]